MMSPQVVKNAMVTGVFASVIKHKDALYTESMLDKMEEAAFQYVTVVNHR